MHEGITMNNNREFKIESLSMAEKFMELGWITLRVEIKEEETGNLLAGEAGVAVVPQCTYTLTTLGQKHIVEIKPFITNYLELQASNVIQ